MADDGHTMPTDDEEHAGDDGVTGDTGDGDSSGDGDPAPRDEADQARRIERLRRSLLAADPADLKRAVLVLPQPSVEALAKAARVRVPVLRAGSIKSLRRVDDPVLLDLLAGIVADECLEAVRERLGDEADDPRPEAVAAAVDDVTDHQFPATTVRLTLAMVAAGLAEAADICNGLLDTDPRFELADEVDQPAVSIPRVATSPRAGAGDEKRAARRARQAEEAERRRAQQDKAVAAAERRRSDRKRALTAASDRDADAVEADGDGPVVLSASPSRRRPALTGDEAGRFNADDPLVGSVVIAEVVFEPDDPDHEPGAKRRPCVVIGVSPSQLLVRPGYSEGGVRSRDWMSCELRDWRAARLDKPSWVETGRRRIDRAQADPPLGRLSDHDWNALW